MTQKILSKKKRIVIVALVVLITLIYTVFVLALPTEKGADAPRRATLDLTGGFTYQGFLIDGDNPADGNYDLQFELYDAATGGNQIGTTLTEDNVAVAEGLFTVLLDFGNPFDGTPLWLEIGLRPANESGSFTVLSPRQSLTPAPYALYALNADYANVVIVAESGGDFTSVQAALDSITDNTFDKRYLVWVAPGAYIGQVTMKPYVDIEGAGVDVTFISDLNADPTEDTGTVIGANNAELRHVTIVGGSSAPGAYGVAMYNNNVSPSLKDVLLQVTLLSGTNGYALLNRNGASPLLEDVTAVVDGTGGIQIGIYNDDNSSPTMRRVTAEVYLGVDNRGIYNRNNSNPTMTDVTAVTDQATNANVNRAIYNNGSAPVMQHITAVAQNAATLNAAVYNDAGSAPTLLDVAATAAGGQTAVGIQASNSTTMTVEGGRVTAESSSSAFGVLANGSPITMTHTVIEVTDSSSANRGLQVQATSAWLQDVSIAARGTTDNRAIQVQDASLTMHNSVVEAMNGSNNLGVFNSASSGSYTVTIFNSQITADFPLFNDAEFTTRLGATYLNGGAVQPNGGTVTCAGVYDEAFVFYASTCP